MTMQKGSKSLDELRRKSRARREHAAQNDVWSTLGPARRNDLAPKLELVERPLNELKLPSWQVRKSEAAQISRIRRNVEELGFCRPILISLDDEVIDGVTTLEALRQLGQSTVSCIVVAHLTKAQRDLLRISINRIPELGAWNFDELKFQFEELISEEMPIDVSGFSAPEIDQIMMEEEPSASEVGELAPKEGARPVVRLGDVIVLGQHRLICGDARDPRVLQQLMHKLKARLILTDEPYNVRVRGHVTRGNHREFAMAAGEMSDDEFLQFNLAWMGASLTQALDGAVLGTFIDWRHLHTVLGAAAKLELPQLNLIVWAKTNAGQGSLYRSQHELLPIFKIGSGEHVNNVELGRHGRWRSNLWTYAGASSMGSDVRAGLKLHPTVKPHVMLEDALMDLTRRGEVVLDVFAGSGSMIVAAQNTGRRAFCVELDPLYCDVIVRRWQTLTGDTAIFEATGERFDDAEARASALLPAPPKVLLLPAPGHIDQGAQ